MGTQGILDIAGIIKTPLLLLSSNNVSCLSVGDIHFCKISPLRACSRQYGCMDFVQMHPFSESISLTQGRVSHREEQFLGAFGLIILCTLGVAEKRQWVKAFGRQLHTCQLLSRGGKRWQCTLSCSCFLDSLPDAIQSFQKCPCTTPQLWEDEVDNTEKRSLPIPLLHALLFPERLCCIWVAFATCFDWQNQSNLELRK